MDISAFNSSQKNITVGRNAASAATEVDGLASQINKEPTNRNGEKDNSVAQDSATLSTEGLKLSSTASVRQATNQTQIPDRQKAQEAAGNIITAIQNNPVQAQNAFANASSARTANALA